MFIKSLSYYALSSIYQALLTFLTILIFTKLMVINDFAMYNLYLALVPFLMNLLLLGMPGSVSVFYYKNSMLKYRLYLGQILFFLLPGSFLISMVLYTLFQGFLVNLFNFDYKVLFFLILFCFFQILPQIMFKYFQTVHEPKNYFYFNISYITLIFICNIASYYYTSSILYVIISSFIVSLLFSLISVYIFYLRKLFIFKFNYLALKAILVYGIPLVVHSIAMAMLFVSDRFFISYFEGNYDVAQYSVSLQLSMIIFIFVNAFAGAWGAHVFRYLKNTKSQISDDIKKKIFFSILFFLFLPFILIYFQKLILYIFFSNEYQDSFQYILIIGIGYSIMGIYKVFIAFIYYNKKTNIISSSTVYSMIINLVLNYIFIKYYGSIGVAYSTMISMIFLTIITIYHTNKQYNFQWSKNGKVL